MASVGQGATTVETITSSPQSSPLRENMVQILPISAGTEVPPSELDKEMGEVRQEEECQEADPTVAFPSTIAPKSASPTRAYTDEPIRTEATPTSEAANDRASATQVVEGGDALPQ